MFERFQAEVRSKEEALERREQACERVEREAGRLKRDAITGKGQIISDAKREASRIQNEAKNEKAKLKKLISDYESKLNFSEQTRKCADGVVQLNVGGVKFTTSLSTLRSSRSKLSALFVPGFQSQLNDTSGAFFIDRNGEVFGYILDWLRSGETNVYLPESTRLMHILREEAAYFGMNKLLRKIDIETGDSEKKSDDINNEGAPKCFRLEHYVYTQTRHGGTSHTYDYCHTRPNGIPLFSHLYGDLGVHDDHGKTITQHGFWTLIDLAMKAGYFPISFPSERVVYMAMLPSDQMSGFLVKQILDQNTHNRKRNEENYEENYDDDD